MKKSAKIWFIIKIIIALYLIFFIHKETDNDRRMKFIESKEDTISYPVLKTKYFFIITNY